MCPASSMMNTEPMCLASVAPSNSNPWRVSGLSRSSSGAWRPRNAAFSDRSYVWTVRSMSRFKAVTRLDVVSTAWIQAVA